jgi:hypothetical protein
MLSSYTTTLPSDVMLDTGILYIGNSIFAAQDGGIKFDPGKTFRQIAFDGQRSRIRGLDRTVMFAPKITGNVLELSPTTIPSLEPGAQSVSLPGSPTGFTTGYEPKSAGTLFLENDYISTPRCIWQRGDGTYVQVRFYDGALVTKWDLAGTDKQEVKIAIELEAVLDMTVSGRKVSDPPFVIEFFATSP